MGIIYVGYCWYELVIYWICWWLQKFMACWDNSHPKFHSAWLIYWTPRNCHAREDVNRLQQLKVEFCSAIFFCFCVNKFIQGGLIANEASKITFSDFNFHTCWLEATLGLINIVWMNKNEPPLADGSNHTSAPHQLFVSVMELCAGRCVNCIKILSMLCQVEQHEKRVALSCRFFGAT